MNKNNRNICKFVSAGRGESLHVYNFVYEKNPPETNISDMPKHFAVYVVTDGEGRLTSDGVTTSLTPGILFFTHAGVPYRLDNTSELKYMYITFDGSRAETLLNRFGINARKNSFEGMESLISFWHSCLVKANDSNLDIVSESVLLYTFSEINIGEESTQNELITEMLEYIDDNFADPTLSLTAIAIHVGYSPKYVSRFFKQQTGTSFSEHLTNMRIRHAVFLMENGVTAVKNVALLTGYSDPFYFSKVFASVIGMSPSKYLSKRSANN